METRALRPDETIRREVSAHDWRPRNCVWELTLACNLRCTHCGSRAGRARVKELTTDECLDVVDQLAALGAELVTLSGGEPTLRPDWDVIARALVERGVKVNMVTNGVYRDAEAAAAIARRARDAGLCNVGLSVDGPREIHDTIRGAGSLEKTLVAMSAFREAGLPVGLLTTVSRANLYALEEVRALAVARGAQQWRLQLAKPMGAMTAHRLDILQPEDLLYLVPLLARLKALGGVRLSVGDSIGYYGPYDEALRGQGWRGRKECWQGCQAGMQALGLQADGGVKGCLSLQAGADRAQDPFLEGNLREATLDALWHRPGAFAYNRDLTPDQLTGGCAACRFGVRCRGGARCVSSAVADLVTEDPYCYTAVATARGMSPEPAATGHRAAAAAFMMATFAGAACETGTTSPAADVSALPRDARPSDRGSMSDGGKTDAQPLDAAAADARRPDARRPDASPPDASPPGASPPDASPPDAGIDCGAVCCACEYGIIPPEVYEFCCAPCVNVCCECDYGQPPPPQCCP